MACENLHGIKNIMITFRDCDTGTVIGPISHELANEDDLPQYRTCDRNGSPLPGGKVKINKGHMKIMMNIVRDLRVPLAWYQNCAAVDVQIEHLNGLVYTAVDGASTGEETSDAHEVSMEIIYKLVDELLPPNALVNA